MSLSVVSPATIGIAFDFFAFIDSASEGSTMILVNRESEGAAVGDRSIMEATTLLMIPIAPVLNSSSSTSSSSSSTTRIRLSPPVVERYCTVATATSISKVE